MEFAQAENATQLVLGATQRSRWGEAVHGSVINKVIRAVRATEGIDIHIISQREDAADAPAAAQRLPLLPRRHRLAPLPRRRVLGGWVAAVVGMPALALAMVQWRDSIGVVAALPMLLVGAILVAAAGGVRPGIVAR